MARSAAAPAKEQEKPILQVPTDLKREGVDEISASLRPLLADVFALYVKTKNFHWHMSGRSFRDYHLLLDEHADQIFAMTDDIAERARKIGASTIHSIGDIARHQRLKDSDAEVVTPKDMLVGARCRQFRADEIASGYARDLRQVQRRGHGQLDRSTGSTRPNGGRGSSRKLCAISESLQKDKFSDARAFASFERRSPGQIVTPFC